MARTTINSLGVPAGTITAADLDFPLTDFSSTGIDDNASTTALTIDSSGNITVTGTVDGRDLATDGTKLDGIAASATNYGDSDVATYISGNRTYGNITTTGYLAGPSTFTIDPAAVGDNTGTLVIAGNLQVDGTTTTINSTTMTVDDLNITLASGAANAAAANGAGITVDGASATLTYNGTNDDWNFNKTLNVSGDLTVDTNTLYVDSTNNRVGIGESSPQAKLDVSTGSTLNQATYNGQVKVGAYSTNGNTDSGIEWQVRTDGAGYGFRAININAGGGNQWRLQSRDNSASWTDRITVDQGNVGIGAAGNAKLQVFGPLAAPSLGTYNNSTAIISNNAGGYGMSFSVDGAGIGYIQSQNFTSSAAYNLSLNPAGGNVGIGVANSTNGKLCVDGTINITDTAGTYAAGALGYTDSNWGFLHRPPRAGAIAAHAFQSFAGSTLMTVTDGGNLGIGTTSPAVKLDVATASGSAYVNINRSSQSTGEVGLSLYGGTSGINWSLYQPTSSNDIRFYGNGADRLSIDSSGNVGIGTSSPASKLEVNGATGMRSNGGGYLVKFLNSSSTSELSGFIYDNNQNNIEFTAYDSSYALAFKTNNTERMRIDTSGNLLVGKTSTSLSDTGHNFSPSGFSFHTRSGGAVSYLNRTTSDGDIQAFYKDGTAVGSIGSEGGDSLFIFSGDTGLRFSGGADSILPCTTAGAVRDNAIDLGIVSSRFDDIYATNGTIQTSDANEKQDIEALSEAEQRVAVAAKGLLRKFRWKSAVEEKGDDARVHFGIIAQDLQAAFEAEGLDAGRYGMFIHSTWTDEETGEERSRMGVRYSELLAFIIAAI